MDIHVINKRSSHASGVILYDNDPFEMSAFMRTPSWDLITQYDLHDAEYLGNTKYDFLVTEISDKIICCLDLLKKDKLVEDESLRNLYDKHLHPEILDTKRKEIWEHLAAGDVLDVFQFSTGVGLAIAKRLKPTDPLEMTAANAMMRLMSEPGQESQQDRYMRIKENGIEVFEQEMIQYKVPEEMRKILHESCDRYYGCCAIQEQMMMLLMDCAHFSLAEANSARKVVAKKQMNKIPELREQVFSRFENQQVAQYFWDISVRPQLGYAFSMNHSLPYSFVGIQTIELATRFNPIYWDTACLIVNSGSINEADDGTTDYAKIAKAIGDIRSAGIKVSLADINKSEFGFSADAQNSQIIFGLKGLTNVGTDIVAQIIQNRPYKSVKDFINKINPSKTVMIALIKGGAFDNLEDRKFLMAWYLWNTCDKKNKITLQNFNGLIENNLIPEELNNVKLIYLYNKTLKSKCKFNSDYYRLTDDMIEVADKLNLDIPLETGYYLDAKLWDRAFYQKNMDIARTWIQNNQQEILETLNNKIFSAEWEKYAKGSLSKWEMDALCFYYHDHELKNVNKTKYNLIDFSDLPEEPEVERTFMKGNMEIKMFKLHRICGTCIAKNKTKSTISLLTTSGVINVKFRDEYFSLFDRQISEKQDNDRKKIMERSWFTRGTMLMILGIRRGDDFIAKKYASYGNQHQLYKITQVLENGDIVIQDERYSTED